MGWGGQVAGGGGVGYFSGTASDRRLPTRTGEKVINAHRKFLTLKHCWRSKSFLPYWLELLVLGVPAR